MLGGEDRRTLFLVISETSEENRVACKGSFEAERRSTAKGWVETVTVAVPGAGWP